MTNGRLTAPLLPLPVQPGLVVGCWDGAVSCWQLPNTAARPFDRLVVTFCVRGDNLPIRRLQWCPLPAAGEQGWGVVG